MNTKQLRIILAFAVVYIVWGSTYLAIRFAIETIPTFTMAGLRFLIAGLILYVYCISRGWTQGLTTRHWVNSLIVGGLLLAGGNGSVVWAEHYVPSGPASLFVAMVPWWMVIIEWIFDKQKKPNAWTSAGLSLGLLGVMILVLPAWKGQLHPVGTIVLLLASLWWAMGSIYAKRTNLPTSVFTATAMNMMCGGAILLIFSFSQGEWSGIQWSHMSEKSVLAFVYLIVFGALLGFSVYIWLLNEVSSSLVSTFAFVNPVVAVFLGWAFNSEPITAHTLIAATVIIAAVVLIIFGQKFKSISIR